MQLSIDIGDEVKHQNRFLNDMVSQFKDLQYTVYCVCLELKNVQMYLLNLKNLKLGFIHVYEEGGAGMPGPPAPPRTSVPKNLKHVMVIL